jgi:PIN domain nuclease of toxin-antitoxin system
MRILFDSHALVWFLDGDSRFSRTARVVIEQNEPTICVSAVSAWEIANKVRLGKWPEMALLAETFAKTMERYDFEPLAITIRSTACWRRNLRSRTCRW